MDRALTKDFSRWILGNENRMAVICITHCEVPGDTLLSSLRRFRIDMGKKA